MKKNLSATSPSPSAFGAAKAYWQTLAAREQNLLLLAASVVGLALLWWLALAPALHSLRTADARRAKADQQLSQMLRLQQEAEQLRSQPSAAANTPPARELLQSALTQELGSSAQLNWVGPRAQITLKAAPAPALARWLSQVRSNTHAVVSELKLNKAVANAANADRSADDSALRWDGSLLLDWPDTAP